MFKPVKAKSIEEYFALLPPEKREVMDFLDQFIRKTVPSLKPLFAYNMPGYGTFKYKSAKKELLDWPIIALANQKNYISIYVCAIDGNEYIAEKYKNELGKVDVGKSCIRIKKLQYLNLETLAKVLKYAEKTPGLVSIGDKN